jgi:hypothetical protein
MYCIGECKYSFLYPVNHMFLATANDEIIALFGWYLLILKVNIFNSNGKNGNKLRYHIL